MAAVFIGGKLTQFAIKGQITASQLRLGSTLSLTLRNGDNVDGDSLEWAANANADPLDEGQISFSQLSTDTLQLLSYKAVDHCQQRVVPLSIKAKV